MNHISSREYKLILNSDRFPDRGAASKLFKDLLANLAHQIEGEIRPQDGEEIRRITYLDTPDFQLWNKGYALRLRHEQQANEIKLTLKFRSPDIILAEAATVETSDDRRAKMKFEENLLPPFRSVFSRSSSIRFKNAPALTNLTDAIEIFPALKKLDIPSKNRLQPVNGFSVMEVFLRLCEIDFKDAEPIKLGLSFWYPDKSASVPVIAECAYDISRDVQKERFDLDQIKNANKLFQLLQDQTGWFDTNTATKTDYAYEAPDTSHISATA